MRILPLLLPLAWLALCATHLVGQQAHGRRFAIIIGVTGYPSFPKENRLLYADKDAELFRDELKKPECGGFRDEDLILLTNASATRTAILQAIDRLKRMVLGEDIVYFFFAGHGVLNDEGRGYLMPYDADRNLPDDKGIASTDILRTLNEQLNVRHLLCFFDACHAAFAGGDPFSRGGEDNVVAGMKQALIGDSNRTTMAFFSCSSAQQSFEDPDLGHGLFTWYLVQAMEGAADRSGYGNRDGIVDANEAFQFIFDSVAARSVRYHERQLPDRVGFNGDFRLGIYGAPEPIHTIDTTGPREGPLLSDLRNTMQEGYAAIHNGNFHLSATRFRTVVNARPNFDTAYYNLGIVLMELDSVSDAITAFRKATELTPPYAHAHYGLGVALLKTGSLDGAVVELSRTTKLAPEEPDPHFYLSRALVMTGDLEGAALELESYASTTRDPSRADQARASAEQLHQEAAYIREGRRLAREDEIDDALAQLYNVLRIDQSSSVAYFEIGRVRYQDHDFKQAVESLKYARQLNWNHADTHYLLADAYEHIGMPAEALEEYKVYLQLAPSGSLVDLARERVGALDRMLSRSPGHEPVSPASHGTPP